MCFGKWYAILLDVREVNASLLSPRDRAGARAQTSPLSQAGCPAGGGGLAARRLPGHPWLLGCQHGHERQTRQTGRHAQCSAWAAKPVRQTRWAATWAYAPAERVGTKPCQNPKPRHLPDLAHGLFISDLGTALMGAGGAFHRGGNRHSERHSSRVTGQVTHLWATWVCRRWCLCPGV